jgi:hypothetical protein
VSEAAAACREWVRGVDVGSSTPPGGASGSRWLPFPTGPQGSGFGAVLPALEGLAEALAPTSFALRETTP